MCIKKQEQCYKFNLRPNNTTNVDSMPKNMYNAHWQKEKWKTRPSNL